MYEGVIKKRTARTEIFVGFKVLLDQIVYDTCITAAFKVETAEIYTHKSIRKPPLHIFTER